MAQLLADPATWNGKVVRVTGDIAAMCHHRRGWFSVAAADKSGNQVRVLTRPNFLVPEGSIGKRGVAEGTVGLIEVAPGMARHLQKEHKLGLSEDVAKPVPQVVIRATGAEFI